MDLNIITPQDAARAEQARRAASARDDDVERDATAAAAPASEESADDVYSRLLKYIPAPLIGLYLMVQNLIMGADDPSELLAWAVFTIFAALVVAYLVQREVRRITQLSLTVVAFAAWATASPGPFQLISGWEQWYGTVALAIALAVLVSFRIAPLAEEGAS